MTRPAIYALAAALAATPAYADPFPRGEIRPTQAMLAEAQRLFPLPADPPDSRFIYHFRRAGRQTLACAQLSRANGGLCTRTTRSDIREIDQSAEGACRYGQDFISHAITGEAAALNYTCVGGHMKREPYASAFDAAGYQYEEWRALP